MKLKYTICFFSFFLFAGCKGAHHSNVIEVNSVPPPFDINGVKPYVVWVNGRRVNMPDNDIMALVNKIGKENIKPANSKDIHRGWLYSYFKGSPSSELDSKEE